jgi:hypothetical protein
MFSDNGLGILGFLPEGKDPGNSVPLPAVGLANVGSFRL